MAETRMERTTDGQTNQAAQQRGITPSGVPGRTGDVTPTSGMGKTTIDDIVVAKIVDIAAREVEGVHDLSSSSGATRAAISGLASRVTGGDQRGQRVNVMVGEIETAVDLAMTVDYGVSIPQVADAVRRNIINRVGSMTGLIVKEVNIEVTDLFFPQEQQAPEVRVH